MAKQDDNLINKLIFLRNSLILISLILFIFSLFQPAFFIDREDADAYSDSLFLFALGWMSFLGGGFIPFLIWLANPFYLISIYLVMKKSKYAITTISFSIILAIIFGNLNEILTSESGASSKITELGNGYYLWLSSFIVLLISSLLVLFKKANKNSNESNINVFN